MTRPSVLALLLLLAGCGPTYVTPPPPQYVSPYAAGPGGSAAVASGGLGTPGLTVVEPTGGGLDETRVVVSQGAGATPALERIPFQVWPAVPGHVVGLLYVSGPQGWGLTYEHTRGLATEPSRVEYKFGFDRSSPYAEYFVSHGEGYNFLQHWNPSGPPHDAAMFTSTTPNPWGLARKAHVVELEVNDGQGAAANNVHFVVTGARVLDGTAAVPMDPERVLLGLRARFDRTRRGIATQTDAIVAHGAADATQRGAVDASSSTVRATVGLWPTWVRSSSTLEVLFVADDVREAHGPTRVTARPCPPCPCAPGPGGMMVCAPCARCDPTPFAQQDTFRYGSELAVLDRVDASGRLLEETVWGPRVLPSVP